MEPLTPDDPLWKLMGRARPVVPRPNFTQNVLRAARQQSQRSSWLEQIQDWLALRPQAAVGGAFVAALVLVTSVVLIPHGSRVTNPAVVASAPAILPDAEMAAIVDVDVSAPLDSLDHIDALVAMQDTSALTDTEVQFLLY